MNPTQDHEVGVWPDRFVQGVTYPFGPYLNKKQEPFEPLVCSSVSLKQALEDEYDTEAMVTCYQCIDVDGSTHVPAFPFFHKAALERIRKEGGELLTTCIGLDWDTGTGPTHVPLTENSFTKFIDMFEQALEEVPMLNDWFALYTTKKGARVFYKLKKPVPVDKGEKYAAALRQKFLKHGLEFDAACSDWSRRYLLPNVVRDGERSQDRELFCLEMQEAEIDITQLPMASVAEMFRPRTFTPTDQYPSDHWNRLWEPGESGGDRMTKFHKKAKQAIRGTKYYPMLFGDNVPFPSNSRHDFLLKIIGFITPLLLKQASAQPEDIFALLHDSICQWDPETCDEDPHAHAWTIIQNIYVKDMENLNEEMVSKAEEAEESRELIDQMVDGMKEWCDHPDLTKDAESAQKFVLGHLFANQGKVYLPLREDGWYGTVWLEAPQLISRIRKTYLNSLVKTSKVDTRGNEVDVSQQTIINNHTTMVVETELTPLQTGYGSITEMDGNMPKLYLPMYRRSPHLKPEYNEHVDGWLRAFGGTHYEPIANWIAYSQDYEAGAICALSIKGPKSAGKQLLASGLSETLEYPALAPAEDICGRFGNILEKTPFVYVDERWPKEMSRSPSDLFRKLTAGTMIAREGKNQPLRTISNPVRVLMTANDHGVRDGLLDDERAGHKRDSVEAVGIRLLHFDIDDGAVDYLYKMGGKGFTNGPCNQWIRGEQGQPSDFIVAKHFLWLYENRKPRDTRDRFCVMGNCADMESDMYKSATHGDVMSQIMSAIIEMIENKMKSTHLKYEDDDTWVTRGGVLAQVRSETEGKRVTEGDLDSCLKNISKRGMGTRVMDNMEFFPVDVGMLASYARTWGKAANKLHELAAEGK